ncbi:hypothetical protein WR25_14767 [Diploscapter pachys]|uniref:Uncharacterized protein n=1 Tax=Diploscapter pachys TaxID=2018661 RepID=A0A2A2K5L6_9BILA|nr:hypothetical protein WR25_14767 [Diploscapter pachys]
MREARRDEAAEQLVVDRHAVVFQAGVPVLADRIEPVIQFHLRRQQVGRVARTVAPNADQRIGLVRACAQNAARAVVFERSADQMHAVREQRGGERIPLPPRIALAVEGKVDRRVADHGAARDPVIGGLHA